MNTKSSLIYLIAFTLIAIVSVAILHIATHHGSPKPKNNAIDTFVTKATYTSYNKSGYLQTKIFADKAAHIKKQKIILLTKPRMLTFSDDRIPWRIQADHGRSDDKMSIVTLRGNVLIHQLSAKLQNETTITTKHLTIFPKKSLAKTQDYVTIYRHGNVIHGVGLIANLKTGTYELLAHSAGIYTPKKQR